MSATRRAELKEAGVVVGETSASEFFFACPTNDYPPRWEYLVVYAQEEVDGRMLETAVVAQTERIISASSALTEELDLEALKRVIQANIHDVRTWARARVLGYLARDADGRTRILQPRRAIVPGQPVYVAPGDVLREFYTFTDEEGLHIGSLITRPDVPVHVSVQAFRRHAAIIAQTGGGKSYCAGVLIEGLLRKGATVVVLDPHADYVLMGLTRTGGRFELAEYITVFRNPASTGRYTEKEVGRVRSYELAFNDLTDEEVFDLAGIRESAVKQRNAVSHALDQLRGQEYGPADLVRVLEEAPTWAAEDRELLRVAQSVLPYVRSLQARLRVFTRRTTPVAELLKPRHLAVIDLSGLGDRATDYIAERILTGIYDAVSAANFPFPVFVFLEEAHKFIPPRGKGLEPTRSSTIINRIAAEGRKFGVFLTLITQRPSKVDPDSLSQANSQIIMRLTNPQDQAAVEASSEQLSRELLTDLPGLNPGEAIIVGELTRAPVMVRVGPRTTKEGGADIDVADRLREAQRVAQHGDREGAERSRREPFRGSFPP